MSNNDAKARARALIISAALLLSGTAFIALPASAASFNNVQIFVSTTSSKTYDFQYAAYNLSGSLIASYQSPYPAAAFELPSGGYLFTVSAIQFEQTMGYACPVMKGGATSGSGASSPGIASNDSSPPVIMPLCRPPSSEYGYAVTNISGAQTINIDTKNVSALPTTPVTVKVSYVNGTAAAGASVYASIVGEWYYWWWANPSINMSGLTDSSGTAHLVIPAAPAVVTAWNWIPITSGKNGSTIQTTVGGEKVNVTVYWQPTYVGLSGSGLLLPPQNSISITLHYQQPDYWVMPAGVDSKGAYVGQEPAATVASRPNGTPSLATGTSGAQGGSQYYLPQQIPQIQNEAALPSTGAQGTFLGMDALTTAAVILIAVALAAVLLAARFRTRRSPTPVG